MSRIQDDDDDDDDDNDDESREEPVDSGIPIYASSYVPSSTFRPFWYAARAAIAAIEG